MPGSTRPALNSLRSDGWHSNQHTAREPPSESSDAPLDNTGVTQSNSGAINSCKGASCFPDQVLQPGYGLSMLALRGFGSRLRAFYSRHPTTGTLTASASTLLLATSLTMAAYSTTVTKRASLESAPDDAAAKPHHVISSRGVTTKFKNPYPSNGDGVDFLTILSKSIRLAGQLPPNAVPNSMPSPGEPVDFLIALSTQAVFQGGRLFSTRHPNN